MKASEANTSSESTPYRIRARVDTSAPKTAPSTPPAPSGPNRRRPWAGVNSWLWTIQNWATSSVAASPPKTYRPKTPTVVCGLRRNQPMPKALPSRVSTSALRAPTHATSRLETGVRTSVPTATATYTKASRSGGRRVRNRVSRAVSTSVCAPMSSASTAKDSPNARPSPERISSSGGKEERTTSA